MVSDRKTFHRGNPLFLRGLQIVAALVIVICRWSSLKTALFSVFETGGKQLLREFVATVTLVAISEVLLTIGAIYLHSRLTRCRWGVNKSFSRFNPILEALGGIVGVASCYLLWPRLARSSYFGYLKVFSEAERFLLIVLVVGVVIVILGGIFSILLMYFVRKTQSFE